MCGPLLVTNKIMSLAYFDSGFLAKKRLPSTLGACTISVCSVMYVVAYLDVL